MKKLTRIVTPVMAVLLMAACNSPTDVTAGDLEGTWIASQARYSGLEDQKNNNFDLIENGYTVVFTSDGTGDFAIELTDPDGVSSFITGTLDFSGTAVTVTREGITQAGEVFLEDDQVAFSLTSGIEFDFGNGQETPARLLLVMNRES
jgi:hypothetical protein